MEERLQPRHPARHEAPVLADRVAAHRRLAARHVALQELDQHVAGRVLVERRRPHLGRSGPSDHASRCSSCPCPAAPARGWPITSTGPSAMTSSSASVTTTAISSTRSESGLSPDISMSTQTRFDLAVTLVHERRASRGGCDIISAVDRSMRIDPIKGARLSHVERAGRRASPFPASRRCISSTAPRCPCPSSSR